MDFGQIALPLGALVVSLAVLWKSSQFVISNSTVLARFFGISELAIGFMLVSVATSLPEFSISVLSAVRGADFTALSVGNVLGANISDITLVLGASALAGKLAFGKKDYLRLVQVIAVASWIPLILLLDVLGHFGLGQFAGIILLLAFVGYAYTVLSEKISFEDGARPTARETVFSALWFSAAVAAVIASANFAVDNAIALASLGGFSKAFIGATIVSLGTTLPELSVSVAAARLGRPGIAIGNVLGSCIVNLTLVLGTAAAINPLAANLYAFANLVFFFILANALLWVLLHRGRGLGRNEGLALLGVYAVFILSALVVEARF
ncbi:MAG: sodium:calcium antiporter [Candidatus Micrarchaeia archaeon]|jgi:cation:H+ antiporter